jgi:hypothetical protein
MAQSCTKMIDIAGCEVLAHPKNQIIVDIFLVLTGDDAQNLADQLVKKSKASEDVEIFSLIRENKILAIAQIKMDRPDARVVWIGLGRKDDSKI